MPEANWVPPLNQPYETNHHLNKIIGTNRGLGVKITKIDGPIKGIGGQMDK